MTCEVSVLICTFRRNEQLVSLLADLASQTRIPREIVIVDNDAGGGARAAVESFARQAPFEVRYAVQPVRSISLTRNLSVSMARSPWLGFLDDDERAPPDWLERMVACADRYAADGVLGPMRCEPPENAPSWIIKGNLYALHEGRTGAQVPRQKMWIHNALLRADRVLALEGPFDEAFGHTGGEDTEMLCRFVLGGAKVVWCQEALVTEPVARARLSLRWILLRALGGGQVYVALWRKGYYGKLGVHSAALLALRSAALMSVAAVASLASLPLGRHHAARWLRTSAANLGKLTALFGWRYEEYAPAPPASARTNRAQAPRPLD